MRRASFDHGFSVKDWEAAKAEVRQAMVAVAARREMICYSDLVNKIETCRLEPQSPQLAHMLGEGLDGRGTSRAGNADCRGGAQVR